MRFYRAFLYLYPASWRAEYGAEMCAVFAARRREASGVLAVLALWIEALADAVTTAPAIQWDIFRQDLRYAFRALGRSPGFAITVVTIAALGIGTTTAAYTMVDHVLIRPLPFVQSDRLVRLSQDLPVWGSHDSDISPANYRDWKRMSTSFAEMAAFNGLLVNITGQGEPEAIDGASVSGEMFSLLGIQPVVGRSFNAGDDRDSAPATVILSYGLWQARFAGNSSIIGSVIELDGKPHTVIGVMPEDFNFPTRKARLWTTLQLPPDAYEDRLDTYLYAIGRLKPGVTVSQAAAEMRNIGSRLARAFPKELGHTSVTVMRLRDYVSDRSVLMLKVLLGAAFCVLLIACANLANLMLARALVRGRELAVRTALGAGRERLIRQMLTESLLPALAGGALGLFLAHAALPLAVRLVPTSLPIAEVPSIDPRVLLFAAVLTCATGIIFGLVPALRAGRDQGLNQLQSTGRSSAHVRQERIRSLLVVTEIAGSIVLLVAFGLLVRALWRVQSINPGFRPDHVLTLRTSLPMPRYEQLEARDPFYRHVLSEAQHLPGVTAAAYTSFLPMVMGGGIWPVEIAGHPEDVAKRRTASLRFVTPGFFRAMGIPLLMGRDVSESDLHKAPFVALVSQSFVDRYWGGENPLGRHFNIGNHGRVLIGVVGDVRVRGLERSSEPQVYLSWQQPDDVSAFYAPKDLVIRTTTDPGSLVPALRRIIHQADPDQPVSDVMPLADIVEAETASRRVQLDVLGAFAAMAFLLAAVGIHGLLLFAVAARTPEIGIRIALGAQPSDIIGMTMGDGFRMAAAGVVAGLALAYAAARVLESALAGVKPDDPPTFAAACVLATLMALAGSLLPTLRALRVDPTIAIRAE
ncbi:MAG: ABC transporter permease [Bryobacteraceae bacterium]